MGTRDPIGQGIIFNPYKRGREPKGSGLAPHLLSFKLRAPTGGPVNPWTGEDAVKNITAVVLPRKNPYPRN